MPFIDTVLGGFIAAVAGVVVYRIEAWDRTRKEREQWIQRLESLLSRIDSDSFDGDGDLATHDRRAYRYTAQDVAELLEDHFAAAPHSISDETLYAFSVLRNNIAYLETRSENSDDYIEAMNTVAESAETVLSHHNS